MAWEPSEKARILATDDRPDAFDLIERSLGEAYTCKFATGAGTALQMLERQRFQLALCGIPGPDESALKLIEKIARAYPDTAIVLLAAVDDLRMIEHAFRLGACGYLSKPLWSGQLSITVANALRQQQLRLAAREVGECLAAAIETHDPAVRRHLAAVGSISALLGSELGFDPYRLVLLRAASPLHDVGTIAIPDGVLRKRDRLTESERERMKSHTTVGHEIFVGSESDLLKMAARIAFTHHERFDGSGYPQGLNGEEIPIEGRIVAVVDTLDALLSEHYYRSAFTVAEAVQLIVEERGVHFDPDVVDALVENLDQALALRGGAAQ